MIRWLIETLTTRRGPMNRGDAKRWAAATTLPELCELTAQWLEGRIRTQPGYYGSVDVDPAGELRDALIALNRAGFLTNSSQEGTEDFDGWYQLAAVSGFAEPDTVDWLHDVLRHTPYEIIVHECKTSRWRRAAQGVYVTWREHEDGTDYVTHFGGQLDRTVIGGECFNGCSDAAIDAVCAALQVTIYDPDTGRNTLWPLLHRAALGRWCQVCDKFGCKSCRDCDNGRCPCAPAVTR